MRLFETPAMERGTASMHSCRYCGSILYVTSTGTSKRDWSGPCPACGQQDWVQMKRGEGPFESGVK